jgi:cytochrome c oxidase subunit I+III
LRLGLLAGAVVIVFSVIMWNRPSPPPMSEQEELDFEAEHGVPVRASGSIVLARWGFGLIMLILSIAFGSFVISYFYLRIENPAWPPLDVDRPSLAVGGAVVVLIVIAAFAAIWGRRSLLQGRTARLAGGLGVACAAGLAASAVLVWELANLTFGSSDHSYGSIFYAFAGFAVLVMFIAFVVSAMTLYYAVRGHFTARRFSPVDNAVRMWTGSAIITIGSILVLYGAPYLTT